jgi:hypothetical protein
MKEQRVNSEITAKLKAMRARVRQCEELARSGELHSDMLLEIA